MANNTPFKVAQGKDISTRMCDNGTLMIDISGGIYLGTGNNNPILIADKGDGKYLQDNVGNGLEKTPLRVKPGEGIKVDANGVGIEAASISHLGGIKIGYEEFGTNYPVILDDDSRAFVNVPWANDSVSTSLSNDKLYIIGKTDSSKYTSSPAHYNSSCYMSGGYLYSGGVKVLTGYTEQYQGTVTSIKAGTGLTGGTITSTGEIKIKLKSENAITNNNISYIGVDSSGYLAVYTPSAEQNIDIYVNGAAVGAAENIGVSNPYIHVYNNGHHDASFKLQGGTNIDIKSNNNREITISSNVSSVNSDEHQEGTIYLLGVFDEDTLNHCSSVYITFEDGLYIKDLPVHANSYYTDSDERLKIFNDDVYIDLNKLSMIPKKYFTYISDKEQKMQIGTSAQEIRKLYPELVNESSDGILSVDYAKLSIIALAAIDVLNKRIEHLEKQIIK